MTNATLQEHSLPVSETLEGGEIDSSRLLEDFEVYLEKVEGDVYSPSISKTISVAHPSTEATTLKSQLSYSEDKHVHCLIERFYSCHSDIDSFNEQQAVQIEQELLITNDTKMKSYRMHIGTIPGDMAGKVTLDKAQSPHVEIVHLIEKFLKSLNISYQVLDKNSFSHTNKWGNEPYGCLLMTCTRTMIHGLCSLFGKAFRQQAVGIFTCYTDDADEEHNFFRISRSDPSMIKRKEAFEIVKLVRTSFENFSAQYDSTDASIELHDYCNDYSSITEENVQEVLRDNSYSHISYEVKKKVAKSFLQNEADYNNAIRKANLESYALAIQMSQLHAKSYPEL